MLKVAVAIICSLLGITLERGVLREWSEAKFGVLLLYYREFL